MEYAEDVYNTVHMMHNLEDLTPEQAFKISAKTRDFFHWLVEQGYTTE